MNNNMSDNYVSTLYVRNFMNSFKLVHICTGLVLPNCNFTYQYASMPNASFVDHFMISANIVGDLLQFKALDDLLNMSDHWPLSLSLNLSIVTVDQAVPIVSNDNI